MVCGECSLESGWFTMQPPGKGLGYTCACADPVLHFCFCTTLSNTVTFVVAAEMECRVRGPREAWELPERSEPVTQSAGERSPGVRPTLIPSVGLRSHVQPHLRISQVSGTAGKACF